MHPCQNGVPCKNGFLLKPNCFDFAPTAIRAIFVYLIELRSGTKYCASVNVVSRCFQNTFDCENKCLHDGAPTRVATYSSCVFKYLSFEFFYILPISFFVGFLLLFCIRLSLFFTRHKHPSKLFAI